LPTQLAFRTATNNQTEPLATNLSAQHSRGALPTTQGTCGHPTQAGKNSEQVRIERRKILCELLLRKGQHIGGVDIFSCFFA
jgi:hypothetical protein